MLNFVMYVSDVCAPMAQDNEQMVQGLIDIERTAKQRNRHLNITGVLLVDGGHFIQLLEGYREDLDTLLASISRDARHTNVSILMDEPISKRAFGEWNMDIFTLDVKPELKSEDLHRFRDCYLANEKPNALEVANWVRRLIKHPEIRFGEVSA
ncbi:BLUF domain-containing protein [Simiduia sp. 21SJ11W-1]|uniref:BLUF domain-containing protein n=1 Tax=Simiduia sp. 21SJ11W-1 TaxID=2909669 RepID=UPI0020A0D16A|nr:BLUF domain-containing protein [Simiduia sp. 21SJ11W-1]UTA46688.1 BLUF domain-containing protein [Simiduia sp. 21SJ11W-1]